MEVNAIILRILRRCRKNIRWRVIALPGPTSERSSPSRARHFFGGPFNEEYPPSASLYCPRKFTIDTESRGALAIIRVRRMILKRSLRDLRKMQKVGRARYFVETLASRSRPTAVQREDPYTVVRNGEKYLSRK